MLLDIPARYMWGWGPGLSGYCGSMSIQTVGLYYGNWLTQDAVRGTSGGHDAAHMLLLGDSDCCSEAQALRKLHFNFTSWDHGEQPLPQHGAFLSWSKAALRAGDPVIFGVYMRGDSDPDFDHIVPMVGFDETSVYFNDLHSNASIRADLETFAQTRKGCQGGDTEWSYCLPRGRDYGIRVHGNADTAAELRPTRLRVDRWDEPDYSKEDRHHEQPVELRGELEVSDLTPGASYALLRFDDAATVPRKNFLHGAYSQRFDFTAPEPGSYRHAVKLMSNSTVFFRCVVRPPALVEVLV